MSGRQQKRTKQAVAAIKDILLAHKGVGNEVTSAEIADRIGLCEDATHAGTRQLIKKCADIYELPLSANSRGYFLMQDDSEFAAYIQNLDGRVAGIQARKEMIQTIWKRTVKAS